MLAHLSHGNVVGYHGAWLEYVTTDNVECAIPSKFNVFVNNWGRIFWSFFAVDQFQTVYLLTEFLCFSVLDVKYL